MSLFLINAVGRRIKSTSSSSHTIVRNVTLPTEESKSGVEDDNLVRNIQNICNKSRLKPEHRNILLGQKPYPEPVIKAHKTVLYNRKLYGKYGSKSGVHLGIMWPTKSEVSAVKEFEKVAFPHTINEMVDQAKKSINEREKEKLEVESRIIANMAKLNLWKQQLKDTIAKKEAEALAAKQKKEKLMEEVRRHFGYTVDPRDERFKEMLAQKEKELKKEEKQAKIAEREKKALARLMETHKAKDLDS